MSDGNRARLVLKHILWCH